MKPIYISNFVQNPNYIFNKLLNMDGWLEETSARKEYVMSDENKSYTYGKGIGRRTYWPKPFHPDVNLLMNNMNNLLWVGPNLCCYNVCFLNRYDTQKNQLGWHSDDSPEMDEKHPIAVISFGSEREIWWKLKTETGVVPKENRQLLESGSLFTMPVGFQEHYVHRIPKCDRSCGCRISLTFRKFK